MEGLKETNEIMVFGTLDGEGLTKFKIGNELNNDAHLMLEVFKKCFPKKLDMI